MKKLISLALSAVMLFSFTALRGSAKILEQCYHCGATGQFHCQVCNNTGKVICEGCKGVGYSICQGEPGKGCDNGYYTCPSCNGDGKNRTGDGEIVEGVCGNCSGSGKLRCVVCHTTPGINYCDTCGGTGYLECVASNCQDAKAVGWKCPYCVGTGWLHLTQGHTGEINDGVYNVPEYDDIVRDLNGREWRWGRENEAKPSETQPPEEQPPEQKETKKTDKPPEPEPELEPEPEPGDPLAEDHVDDENFSIVFLNDNKGNQPDSEIKQKIIDIVKTAEPGRMADGEEQMLDALALANGIEDLNEGRIFPLYFEGHIKLDTPIRVTVKIKDNTLEGGCDFYMYHIKESGGVEYLKDADVQYFTYDSGYVESISFVTSEFSTFFTSKNLLTLEDDTSESKTDEEPLSEEPSSALTEPASDRSLEEPKLMPDKDIFPIVPVMIISTLAIAALAVITAVVVIIKKRKKNKE